MLALLAQLLPLIPNLAAVVKTTVTEFQAQTGQSVDQIASATIAGLTDEEKKLLAEILAEGGTAQ